MLLSISTKHSPATELGFLLHKHPDRLQSFDLSFGKAHVFYPEADEAQCTVCLMLDVDPVGMVRGKGRDQAAPLAQYVNDRPYVASSFMSVAISQVLGTALQGRCKARPELADLPIPLSARIDVLPVRAGDGFLHDVFEPLGYEVDARRHPLDTQFPEWGDSPYFSLTIHKTTTLSELLTHLYVLIPVFDDRKHYFVGEEEIEKLLKKGEGWLGGHPARDAISRRYLRSMPTLYRQALARLVQEETVAEPDDQGPEAKADEAGIEQRLSLNDQRINAVAAVIRASGAKRVLDLGCGEGRLVRELLRARQFEEIVGMDVAHRALEIAGKRLRLEQMPERQAERVRLIHGSLMYRDKRFEGFDAAAVVEVIEHFDPPRLAAFERALFEFARPQTVVLTTPNREYNVTWESLGPDRLRHPDHRFEWTRSEFQDWANSMGERFGYAVQFLPVGPEDDRLGPPTQMGVFERA